jgi:ribonucleoside-diphosphate reductase alpha chain
MTRTYEPFYWYNEHSKFFMKGGYLLEGETIEQRSKDIADTAEKYLKIEGFSNKFYDYLSKGWVSLASPVWANYGRERGMPVSCFSTLVSDSIPNILKSIGEVGAMSKIGGGTAVFMGEVRPKGSKISDTGESNGPVSFLQMFDVAAGVVSQGGVRRGKTAAYLPIEHDDIDEFLEIGTPGNPIQDMTTAVTVTDSFMNSMIDGDVEKRKIWGKVLKRRTELGYPYIIFIDNANKVAPQVYKDKGKKINQSNLCSEIMLSTDRDESLTCVLSSVNLLHYDEWKDTDLIEVMTYFLDSVAEEFMVKLEVYRDSDDPDKRDLFEMLKKPYKFTKEQRALGLGVLGWHSYLQSNMISFESRDAARLNLEIFKLIKERSHKASAEMAKIYGEPELLKGYGMRNVTTMAVAPTVSSSNILGQVSPGIEPFPQNKFVYTLAKNKILVKNKYLEEYLESVGHNTKEVWDNITDNDGSVYGLSDEIIPQDVKSVFKKFSEIDQMAILYQASTRGEYIDQGQSLNVMFQEGTTSKEMNEFTISAWRLGIKSLYYQHSFSKAQSFLRNKNSCVACDG